MGLDLSKLHPVHHLLRRAVNRGGTLKMDMTPNFLQRASLMFQTIGKYTALCGSTLLIAMAAASAQAADGQVEFTGVVNDNACTITSESVKKSVDMGQVRIADFPNPHKPLA